MQYLNVTDLTFETFSSRFNFAEFMCRNWKNHKMSEQCYIRETEFEKVAMDWRNCELQLNSEAYVCPSKGPAIKILNEIG